MQPKIKTRLIWLPIILLFVFTKLMSGIATVVGNVSTASVLLAIELVTWATEDQA